jgi:hypothetical protein
MTRNLFRSFLLSTFLTIRKSVFLFNDDADRFVYGNISIHLVAADFFRETIISSNYDKFVLKLVTHLVDDIASLNQILIHKVCSGGKNST